MDTPSQLPQTPPSPTPSPAWRWLWAAGLVVVGVVLGMAFAAYGGADLLLNFSNLRYCG